MFFAAANALYVVLMISSAWWLTHREGQIALAEVGSLGLGPAAAPIGKAAFDALRAAGARGEARPMGTAVTELGHAEEARADAEWAPVLGVAGLGEAELLSVSRLDPGRRVYLSGGRTFKVIRSELSTTSRSRACDPVTEHRILQRLAGLAFVPAQARLWSANGVSVLSYDFVDAARASQTKLGVWRMCVLVSQLTYGLARLSLRGIVHGDLHPQNILVDARGRMTLIDFDQARCATRLRAFLLNFAGHMMKRTHGDWWTTTRALASQALPTVITRALRRVRGSWRWALTWYAARPPRLPPGAALKLQKLREAWTVARQSDANSPGLPIAYYELIEDGYRFPGERPWEERWRSLSATADVQGKRVLELGCNMGLLSCGLLRLRGASAVLGVDADQRILEAARLVASAYGVAPGFARVDFDASPEWERELLAFSPDVVFALNVFNWVSDKERFLAFLGRVPELVYEGHDPGHVETARLRLCGFSRIEVVTTTERGRTVLHATRR
jgi:hypothetical protein